MNAQQLDDQMRRNIAQVRAIAGNPAASRYERGCEIYRNGWIYEASEGEQVYQVRAREGHEPHTVRIEPNANTCTCEDFQFGAPEVRGQRLCKHIVAARLFAKYGDFPGFKWGEDKIVPKLNSTKNGRAQLSPADNLPADVYADGSQIEPELQGHAATFRELTGRQPASRENLTSWIYR